MDVAIEVIEIVAIVILSIIVIKQRSSIRRERMAGRLEARVRD